MKRRLWIVAGVILAAALACGIAFWQEERAIDQEAERILALRHILTLAENRGADWATEELMIDNMETFRKKSLYRKWGEPTEHIQSAKEDIWILSDQFQLVVDYDDRERIACVKVVLNP